MSAPTLVDAVHAWERHFGEPATAFAQAKERIAEGAQDAPARAWYALTIAFHYLFFTAQPLDARPYLVKAKRAFAAAGQRRGELLADIGEARLAIVERAPETARRKLLALYAEAQQALPPEDRFWLLNAIGAAHYFTDRLDEAIRYLYEALECLTGAAQSPQHPAVMSNLAAALVTVGDYAPARELAEGALAELARLDNPQLVLFARSNLAEALTGLGEHDRALALCDAMLADVDKAGIRATQNHYVAIAAEIYARYGRLVDAMRCAVHAQAIETEFPSGFNPVHAQWARAVVADAQGDADAIARLDAAARSAASHRYLPGECKAWARLADRHAQARDFEAAYRCARKLLAAQTQRLSHRASAKYYLLRVEHELTHARAERDRALAQQRELARLNEELARVNADLSHKMIQIEALQAQLEVEAVHDPLTQLFNRRYLDSVTPGLLASATRRGAPLTLALLDLDRFKRVNDRYGHPAGDVVLREIGRVLPMALRPADIVCRYGGEEFCVVLPDADAAGAERVLATLAARLRDLRVGFHGETLGGFTFSAGIAVLARHGNTLDDLLAHADRALYMAKDAGRDRVLVAP
ncbi:MAG TPA: tetratricopeptide repeat-containing diguanylate cyclase [Casimicrobiaceae bacterium]|nr:tetratricopeptide repeat-containing diguanylate cyclase [Casimicrobiaceae bacterium]